MKQCSKCRRELPPEAFPKQTKSKRGTICKKCTNAAVRERRKSNPSFREKVCASEKKYRDKTRGTEASKAKRAKYMLKYRERLLAYKRLHFHANKEKYSQKNALWQRQNKDKLRAIYRRRRSNPCFVLASRLRSVMNSHYRGRSLAKSGKTFDLLGYSCNDLESHLNTWLQKPCEVCQKVMIELDTCHIDHIIPLVTAKTESDIVQLNQLSNLRLICAHCNLAKGCR